MALLPVSEALALILAGVEPLPEEIVPLADAHGRVLAQDLRAGRDQPPFTASAMDGFAVRSQDLATLPAQLRVIGEAPAGRRFEGAVGPGEAVRIFTGAPVPEGADTIVIQENARLVGDAVTIETRGAGPPSHAGGRFRFPARRGGAAGGERAEPAGDRAGGGDEPGERAGAPAAAGRHPGHRR